MKTFYHLLTLALALIILTSCDPSINPVPEVAPELPAAEMVAIPTEVLEDHSADSAQTQSTGFDYSNWVYAGVNLAVWKTVIVVNTAIPTAAFGRAFNETPTFVGNATFEWAYQYQGPFHKYDVVLTGQYINGGDDVEWVMTLSQHGGYQNFEWYRGTTSVDRTESSFTVNHRPFNPEALFRIDYNTDFTDGTIRFTNVRPGHHDNGAYLEYRVEPNNSFNRAFDIYGGPNNGNTIEIQWSEPSGNGRVKSQPHFNDNNWHCWGTDLKNTNC